MNKEIKKIVLAAMFAAIGVVLKSFVSFQLTATLRPLSVWPIPIILAGYFLGPIYGIITGFVTDTGYMLTKGNMWNLFTISAMLWGLAGYLIKKIKIKPYLISFFIVIFITSILETAINTLQMYIWDTKSIAELLIRVISQIVRLPFLALITYMIAKALDRVVKI